MADDLTSDEGVLLGAEAAAVRLAEHCAELKSRGYPAPGDGLEYAVARLMGELWEQGFSQIEIRRAFHNALADLDRYASEEQPA